MRGLATLVKRNFTQGLDSGSRLRNYAHMPNVDDLLTTAQVAKILGKSIPTVNRYATSGELVSARKLPGLRGAYLFTPQAVEAFRARKAVAA